MNELDKHEIAEEEFMTEELEAGDREQTDGSDSIADEKNDTTDESDNSEKESENTPAEKEQEKAFRMRRLLRTMLRDDESEGGSMKDMFNDIQISGEWLKRHWSFLVIVFVCMLLFVTNRYQAQQEIIEESRLKQELNDWRFIWLTQFCELTRSSRQSHIEESLKQRGDSTLKPRKEAPFLIKVK